MRKFTITFLQWEKRPESQYDGSEYFSNYSISENKYIGISNEFTNTKTYHIDVSIDGRKDASWNNGNNFDLSKIVFAYCKDYVTDKFKSGTLRENEKLNISSDTYPNEECNYKSDELDDFNNDSIEIEIN
jgi:hypothetical protein